MSVDAQPQAAIELTGVRKRFGSAQVLHGVDLSVPAGEITVLLGPSGAGKTVTISHIVGLIHPDKGTVEVEGKNLAKISDDELNAGTAADGGRAPGHAAVHLRPLLLAHRLRERRLRACGSETAGRRRG